MCKDKNDLYIKKNTISNFLGEILISDPSIYKMDHPDMTVSKFVENSIDLKRDKPFSSFLSIIEFLCIYPDYWLFLLPTIFILEFKLTNLT